MMADEFNFLWSGIQNYIAEAERFAVDLPLKTSISENSL